MKVIWGATSVNSVLLAGQAVTSITSENDTVVVVKAAQGGNVTGDVVVQADSGAVTTFINGWTYRTEGNVTNVSPGRTGDEKRARTALNRDGSPSAHASSTCRVA